MNFIRYVRKYLIISIVIHFAFAGLLFASMMITGTMGGLITGVMELIWAFLFFSAFFTPPLNMLLIVFSLFEACFNKDLRKRLCINSLLLLLGGLIPPMLGIILFLSSGYRG